jgi:hypothetical protein
MKLFPFPEHAPNRIVTQILSTRARKVLCRSMEFCQRQWTCVQGLRIAVRLQKTNQDEHSGGEKRASEFFLFEALLVMLQVYPLLSFVSISSSATRLDWCSRTLEPFCSAA